MTETRYTEAEWKAEGERRFGPDMMKWRFQCPICGNVASTEDYRPYADKGATANSATCECIGRYTGARPALGERKPGEKPCNYAGYGLFRLSPVRVVVEEGKEIHCFAFAEATPESVPSPAPASPAQDSSPTNPEWLHNQAQARDLMKKTDREQNG